MIIAAFAGTGKTALARLYPQQVVDFVAMPYKYYLTENSEEINQFEIEACKANFDNVMREDWPENYIMAIKDSMRRNCKILLIPSAWNVLAQLKIESIPYYLCYPQRDAKEIYKKRYLNRGNTEDFLSIFIGGWDRFMDTLESDTYGRHIVMQPHKFLSDVIDESTFCGGLLI